LLRHHDPAQKSILGATDAAKLRSCMTPFAAAVPGEPVFARGLSAFYRGPDVATRALLE